MIQKSRHGSLIYSCDVSAHLWSVEKQWFESLNQTPFGRSYSFVFVLVTLRSQEKFFECFDCMKTFNFCSCLVLLIFFFNFTPVPIYVDRRIGTDMYEVYESHVLICMSEWKFVFPLRCMSLLRALLNFLSSIPGILSLVVVVMI